MAEYLLSVHHDYDEAFPPIEEMQPVFEAVDRVNKKMQDEGAWVFAGGLLPVAQATTVDSTGDEAQLLVRSSLGPVGICPVRSVAGVELLKQFDPDLFLLDDGFQHARLARHVDLVVIDTLDPFAGFEVIPAGRLREPIEALARASAERLTRASGTPIAAAAAARSLMRRFRRRR